MFHGLSSERQGETQVIYSDAINISTPYMIKVDPIVYGRMLMDEFSVKATDTNKVRLYVTEERNPQAYAQTSSRFDLRNAGIGVNVELFMGTYWRSAAPRQTGFFRRREDWSQLQEEVIRTLGHEGSHVADFLKLNENLNSLIADLVKGEIAVGLSKLLERRYPYLAALARGYADFSTARTCLTSAGALRNLLRHQTTESRAQVAAKEIDVKKWDSLVDLRSR